MYATTTTLINQNLISSRKYYIIAFNDVLKMQWVGNGIKKTRKLVIN